MNERDFAFLELIVAATTLSHSYNDGVAAGTGDHQAREKEKQLWQGPPRHMLDATITNKLAGERKLSKPKSIGRAILRIWRRWG
jgi:hypothetical protein